MPSTLKSNSIITVARRRFAHKTQLAKVSCGIIEKKYYLPFIWELHKSKEVGRCAISVILLHVFSK